MPDKCLDCPAPSADMDGFIVSGPGGVPRSEGSGVSSPEGPFAKEAPQTGHVVIMGTLGVDGNPGSLPDAPQVGWAYIAGDAGEYGGVQATEGDMVYCMSLNPVKWGVLQADSDDSGRDLVSVSASFGCDPSPVLSLTSTAASGEEAVQEVDMSCLSTDWKLTATGSTTGRTLPERFADVVNVKDFGAVCDGIADDTTAFQAAAAAASGKRIFIPQGSVNLSESVSGSFYSDGEIDFTGHPIAVNIVTKDLNLKDNPSFGALYSFTDSDESYGFLAQGVARSGKYLFVPTNQYRHGLSRLYKIDTETGTRTYASLAEDKHFSSITIYNDKVYIVDSSSPSNIYIYDLSLTLESIINLDFYFACIAYDEKRDCFWLLKSDSQGFSLYQYTTELVATGYHFVIPNSDSDSSVYAVIQDFCVYDGYFYFARSNQDLLSSIIFVTDVDGSIKKTYFLDESFGELEGVCITSDYSADIACNDSNNKNIAIYNAEIFNNGFNPKPVTPFRNIGGLRAVSNHKPLSYVYADASFSGAYSDGSSARPFKSIVEAFNYIIVRNIKYQTGVVLSLKGDFSAEEAIAVYGFNGSLFVLGDSTATTKVNSLYFESCDYVQLSNIDFKATAPFSAGMAVNILNTPVVDIRGLSFTPSTKLSTACFNAIRCMVYFVSPCSFSNAVNGIRLYQATANIGADHTFTSCDTNTIIFHSLVYGTAARLSGVTSSGSTSVKLTTA